MSLDPVRRPTLSAEVLGTLRRQITDGVWPVGTRIPPEPELMRQLGVARGTVREAVRALAHAGLLEVRQGDGTYVRAASELSGAVQRLYNDRASAELLDVRDALEGKAARLAATHATNEDLDALAAALERRAAAWASRDFDGWASADWEFHTRVADASGNTLLAVLYRNLTEPLRASMSGFWERPGFNGADPAGHEDLLAALHGKDPAEAARQADANINATAEWHRSTT
ncbi:FadR family transcriptional regulator [Streptomyces sp. TRM72054]|uniref:FadR/GntR family transcriptional regulator n=1 Tax=Streptomyces sp. TRM72054 TaxID=2870562 RepID=UPI001C8C7164|nr:FadR/GntR family transcriptional regulator [Streptomyces sp. TRM72054]MBX9396167.1 FadR family transcriptional regulator [Streptomyces sp. TRM72054]